MAHSDESASSSISHVPLLTTVDMTTSQYNKTVESLSSEIFNIHTSMIAANEELVKITSINELLNSKNEELELKLVTLQSLESENELKIKAYKNSARLVETYHNEHSENYKVGLGFNYDKKAGNKHNVSHQGCVDVVKPSILENVQKPIYKKVEKEFDEDSVIIKQQLLHENKVVDNINITKQVTVKNPKTVIFKHKHTP